jgi:glucose uptake protein GlcU
MELAGTAFALATALFWGSYLVPVKKVDLEARRFVFLMSIGIGILALALVPFVLPFDYSLEALSYLFLSGILWSMGNLLSIYAVRGLGVARAVPVFSISVIVNAVYGVWIFGEIKTGLEVGGIFLGIFLMVAGVGLAMQGSDLPEKKKGKKSFASLIAMAAATGCFFGSYNAPIKAAAVDPFPAIVGMLAGTAITCFVISFIPFERVKPSSIGKRETGLGILSGFLWAFGTLLSIFALAMLGLARYFPITLVNVFIYVGWGLLYFKEVDRSLFPKIIAGAIVLFVGATIVALV